jgi:SAM-dependent methyltransferase
MLHLSSVLYEEIVDTLKRPHRIIRVFNKQNVAQYIKAVPLRLLRARIGKRWVNDGGDQRFKKRVYSSYRDYLAHQKDKLQRIDLSEYDVKYRDTLRERLEALNIPWQSKTVLCLAARLGTEVKSFLDLGSFAVGLDINPGSNNPYVLYGDFHAIQFPSNSVDVVFTNSLDHAFDIQKLVAEIRRVSKSEGYLIVEAERGAGEKWPGFYESFYWSRIGDLISCLEGLQLKLLVNGSFDYPWQGHQLVFRIEK